MAFTASATPNDDKLLEPPPVKDEDPDGSKLLAAPDALELAAKFLNPVVAITKDNFDVWIVAYDLAIRRSQSKLTTCVGGQFLIRGFRKVFTSGPGSYPCSLVEPGRPRTSYTNRRHAKKR